MTDDIKHFFISGSGRSEEEAAVSFARDLLKEFPAEAGMYEFYIRTPMEHSMANSFSSGNTTHNFFLRGSYKIKERQIKRMETFIGLPKDGKS